MNHPALYKNSFDSCPLTFALTLIGRKWNYRSFGRSIKTEPCATIKKEYSWITHMMLTESLKELESYGIVHRKQFMEVPPRVEYSLTDQGENLIPALKALADWGKIMRTVVEGNGV